MKKLRALWKLTRLDHGVMIAIAIFIGALIAGKGLPPMDKFFFAFLTALFLEAGAFALNDYFDLEVDKKNRRMDRPLVSGDLKPADALLIYFVFLPAGLAASFMVNTTCFTIAAINAVIATLYDVKLKEIKIIGNFYIAFIMAIPFIFGSTAVSTTIPEAIYFIAAIAFLSGVAREITKDVMDFAGDSARKTKSFPTYLGKRGANTIASVFYLIAIVMSYIPFIFNIDEAYYHDYIYLSIVLVTDILLAYTSLVILTKVDTESMNKCRKTSLMGIFIGLIAFLVGVFA
ncbi:MAG: UbiA family prenyltransferase [Candidatus Thermoplasmatota archaeon]|nr:UbiA family prenyltransferase [Candidatus Thermoplasmatota archaeon]